MCGDFHKIYDLNNNKYINKPEKNIIIGNNVWLSREVLILKDAKKTIFLDKFSSTLALFLFNTEQVRTDANRREIWTAYEKT